MIIEDKITVKLSNLEKVNDNIIYLADCEVEINRIKKLKKEIKRDQRFVFIKDILFEKNPGEANAKHSHKMLEVACKVDEFETLIVKKVILKKELSCSLYKR